MVWRELARALRKLTFVGFCFGSDLADERISHRPAVELELGIKLALLDCWGRLLGKARNPWA
jgi:hypothetical protein